MAKANRIDCVKTKAGSTGRDKLLLQVLDSTYTSGMVPVKCTLIKVGTMGEKPVQKGCCKVAKTKVQGATPFISTLAIGTSIM